MKELNIQTILDTLERRYPRKPYTPHQLPLDELIQTILSQNTSDINSRPAFRRLKKVFSKWDELLTADIETIMEPIKEAGLGKIKAQRIRDALREITSKRGLLELDFLNGMPVREAREWLKALPGVGDKTASCVLLFSFGKPALPVDTHIYRITRRLGLIGEKTTLKEAPGQLENVILPDDIYYFHTTIIEHGRQTCSARKPKCTLCILKQVCPSNNPDSAHPD